MSVSEDVRASYEAASGGFAAEFRGTVREASFRFDNNYKGGDVCLLELLVEPCDEDIEQFGEYLEDGLTSIWYGCGKGWEPADKGATAQHESGKPRKFTKGTNISTLLTHAIEVDGVGDVLMQRGPANQAGIWLGLDLDFELTEFASKNRDGEPIEWTVRLPVEFHGVDEGAEKPKPAAKKAPAKKAAPAKVEADTEDEGTSYDLPAKLRGLLKAIAVNADDHDAFMEAAFAQVADQLDSTGELAVADEDFYLTLKAG